MVETFLCKVLGLRRRSIADLGHITLHCGWYRWYHVSIIDLSCRDPQDAIAKHEGASSGEEGFDGDGQENVAPGWNASLLSWFNGASLCSFIDADGFQLGLIGVFPYSAIDMSTFEAL